MFKPHRRRVLKTALPFAALGALSTLVDVVGAEVEAATKRMPVLFIGHGSPMNAIQDNEFSRFLRGWNA
jgi:4,5-DOPA dioxygenase extradiol